MKMKWTLLATLALAISPALALAHAPQNPGPRVRPNLYHDRSTHIHPHDTAAHL